MLLETWQPWWLGEKWAISRWEEWCCSSAPLALLLFCPSKCSMLCALRTFCIIKFTIFLKQFLQGKFHYLFFWNGSLHLFLLATQRTNSSTQLKLCGLIFNNMSPSISSSVHYLHRELKNSRSFDSHFLYFLEFMWMHSMLPLNNGFHCEG